MEFTKCPPGPVSLESSFQRYNHDRSLGSNTELGSISVETGGSYTPAHMTFEGILSRAFEFALEDFPPVDTQTLEELLALEEPDAEATY